MYLTEKALKVHLKESGFSLYLVVEIETGFAAEQPLSFQVWRNHKLRV